MNQGLKPHLLVVGSGQRVRRAALPALFARASTWHLAGIRSRKPKEIQAETAAGEPTGRPLAVEPLAALEPAHLAGLRAVYVCVSKGAVPSVLAQLATLVRALPEAERPLLFIDTPVLLFKHMGAAKHFGAFPAVYVAEDMASLPWLDTLGYARQKLGTPRHLLLDRSAFAYHGVALAKVLLGNKRLLRARRVQRDGTAPDGGQRYERTLEFAGGQTCTVHEPRDYAVGSVRLECERGVLTLGPEPEPGAWWVRQTRDADGLCVGFTANKDGERAYANTLNDADRELLGPLDGDGPIQSMDAMKRVGFARLLDQLHPASAVEPAWSLHDGLDDMWIDYLLEKTGRWRATRFTSAHQPFARRSVGALMGLASRLKK